MIGDQGRNVSPILLGVLVSWVALIFVGFGINAPRNAMWRPRSLSARRDRRRNLPRSENGPSGQGVPQISSWPIRNAFGACELGAAGPLPFREI